MGISMYDRIVREHVYINKTNCNGLKAYYFNELDTIMKYRLLLKSRTQLAKDIYNDNCKESSRNMGVSNTRFKPLLVITPHCAIPMIPRSHPMTSRKEAGYTIAFDFVGLNQLVFVSTPCCMRSPYALLDEFSLHQQTPTFVRN